MSVPRHSLYRGESRFGRFRRKAKESGAPKKRTCFKIASLPDDPDMPFPKAAYRDTRPEEREYHSLDIPGGMEPDRATRMLSVRRDKMTGIPVSAYRAPAGNFRAEP